MATDTFEWKQNLACVSCYKILTQLLELNPATVTFEKAGAKPLKELTYWPLTTDSVDIKQMSIELLIQRYIDLLAKGYVLKPEKPGGKWKEVKASMREVLDKGTNKVKDLAKVVDGHIKFADE
jgi:hypothetical protein